MTESQQKQLGYVTVKQLVKVGDDSMLNLRTHVLPTGNIYPQQNQESPYAWFSDRINQELLVFVHEILHARVTDNIKSMFEEVCSKDKPKRDIKRLSQYQFRKSLGLRALFVFRPSDTHQHILVPNQCGLCPCTSVCAAFLTEHGRRVLPFLGTSTNGQGYSSLKMITEVLHAYVDCCEPVSSLGIFKVLRFLEPKHKVCMDIASYFRHKEANQAGVNQDTFPEVPTAGLNVRQFKRRTAATKPSKAKKTTKTGTVAPANQPQIKQAFKEISPSSSTTVVYTETDLPADVMDDLFDFDSQPVPLEEVPSTLSDDNKVAEDSTPPPQPPPRKKYSPSSKRCISQVLTDCEDSVSAGESGEDLDTWYGGTPETPNHLYKPQASQKVDQLSSGSSPCLVAVGSADDVCTEESPQLVLDDVTNKSPIPLSDSSSVDSVTVAGSQDDCIQVPSDDDVVCTGSQEGRRKIKVKSTQLTLAQIMEGVRRVSDLNRNKVIQWLRFHRTLILNIFKGKEFSERHQDYVSGAKKRATLKYRVDTSMFGKEELDCLQTNLLKMFCTKNMRCFDYVMSVLVPECVVRLIADVNRVSFDQAEKMMYSYESVDLSQDN